MLRPSIFISRAYGDSRTLADTLLQRGFDPVIAPVLDIKFLPLSPLNLDGVQAFICTSRYGAQALSRAISVRHVPLYAVGSATAQAAHLQGFTQVQEGPGDAAALASLICTQCRPDQGKLIHISGQHIAQDFASLLQAEGFVIQRHVAYVAQSLNQWPTDVVEALKQRRPGAALFFSARSAALFIDRIRQEKCIEDCSVLHAVCLSRSVADACLGQSEALAPLPWENVWIGSHPQKDTLLDMVDCLFSARTLGL